MIGRCVQTLVDRVFASGCSVNRGRRNADACGRCAECQCLGEDARCDMAIVTLAQARQRRLPDAA